MDDGFHAGLFRCHVPQRTLPFTAKELGFLLQRPLFDGSFYNDAQLIRGERFGDEIVGAFFHCLYSRRYCGITCNNDDEKGVIHHLNFFQDFHAAHPGHHQVQEDNINLFV